MSDCIFCKIISWEIPSVKIRENDDFMAILDAFPNTKWMTLVMPKIHYNSDLFDIDDIEFYSKYLLATKEVAGLLKKWLKINRVTMVMEGMWVDHLHIKLYPLHWVWPERKEYRAKQEVYFDQYQWYVTTQLWPKSSPEKLQKVADEILNNI